MGKKMGIQESGNRYIYWFNGEPEDWHAWVYNNTLYVKLAPNKLLIIWSNNKDPKKGEFELFNLMTQMTSCWEYGCSVTMIPSQMFHTRLSVREED